MSSQSRTVSDPNAGGSSRFLWVVVGLVIIAAVVIGAIYITNRHEPGEGIPDLNAEGTFTDNAVVLSAANVKDDAVKMDLFEDFSCHYCAQLAEATDDQMLTEIQNGNLVVTIHPLNFLDQEGQIGHSTAAVAAERALAERGEFNAWWKLRVTLMQQQAEIYGRWGEEEFADAAKTLGASNDAVQDIKDGKYLEAAREQGEANKKKLEDKTGDQVSSPQVFLNDEKVANPQDWPTVYAGK